MWSPDLQLLILHTANTFGGLGVFLIAYFSFSSFQGVILFPFLYLSPPKQFPFPPPLGEACAGVSPYKTLLCTVRRPDCTCLFSTFEYQVTTVKANPSHQYQKNYSKSKTSLQNKMKLFISGD